MRPVEYKLPPPQLYTIQNNTYIKTFLHLSTKSSDYNLKLWTKEQPFASYIIERSSKLVTLLNSNKSGRCGLVIRILASEEVHFVFPLEK